MVRKSHRIVGLIIALPVFLQAASGSLLVFEPEIDAWLNASRFCVQPSGDRLSVQAQFDAFAAVHPDMARHVYILRLPAAAEEATVLLAKPYNEIGPRRGVRFFVNPYNGEISDGQPYHSTLMGKVYTFHRTFWLPRWGRWITSTSAILTSLLAASGVLLVARRWLTRRADAESKLLGFHRQLGASVAPLVAVIALNGAAVTYLFAVIPLLYYATGTEMPVEMREGRSTQITELQGAGRATLDALILAAQQSYPEAVPRVLLQPSVPDTAVTVILRKPHEPRVEGGTMIAMHPQTKEALGVTDFTDGELGHRAVYLLIHLHKGTWGGYAAGDFGRQTTRVIWVLAAASAAILAATGAFAWLSSGRSGSLDSNAKAGPGTQS